MSAWPVFNPWRRWFLDLGLRRKFSLTALIVGGTAAVVVSVVSLLYRLHTLRDDQRTDALATTEIIAQNLQGVVAFEDAAAATTTLAAVRAKPLIRGAVLDLDGRPDFARYGHIIPPERHLPAGTHECFFGWTLVTAANVPGTDHSDSGARLQIETDLRPALRIAVATSLIALLLAVALAAALGVAISFALRRPILDPIDHLRASTRRVARHSDYTLRAKVLSHDELGELTVAFNAMLESLQAGDTALRRTNQKLQDTLADRARLEHELIETSRLAGMAQVATGVLHNVGNVLNSVNVSAQLLRENLQSSVHFRLLVQTADLLKSQGPSVGAFLTSDPRGQLVPSLLIELGPAIDRLRRELLDEVTRLAENVDHIKSIVATQQSYAKVGGLYQIVAPAELFAEVERLTHIAIERHLIQVTRSYDAVPPITTDRHQVLQILVNFVTNAIESVRAVRPDNDRRLQLELRQHGDTVQFIVADNGAGIPPENLNRIFQHGFTTRKDGHGFGLHSGALGAKKLGGQLQVASDGPDRGARFTLQLPLHSPTPPPQPAE